MTTSDTCEWSLVDAEYNLYETSCSDYLQGNEAMETIQEAGQTICPECGRTIKEIKEDTQA